MIINPCHITNCYGLVCNSFLRFILSQFELFEVLYLSKENRYLLAINHNSIAIHSLSLHQLLNGQLAELPTVFGSFFYWHNYYNHFCKGGGQRRATMWQAKAMSTLKQPNGIHWCHSYLHISNKAAVSKAKLISQSCGELQLAVCLSRGDGVI